MALGIGTPIMKLNVRGVSAGKSMPIDRGCRELGPERESRTRNFDPAYSHLNEYHFPPGVTTGQELSDWLVAQVAAANGRLERRRREGETAPDGSRLRDNATSGGRAANPAVTMVIHPKEDVMRTLSRDEQREVLMACVGAYEAWSGHAEVWWAIHWDEGTEPGTACHLHLVDRPVLDAEDPDRYCNKRFTSRERLLAWHRSFDRLVSERLSPELLAKVGGVRHHRDGDERREARARGEIVPPPDLDANTYSELAKTLENKARVDAEAEAQRERAASLSAEADDAKGRRDRSLAEMESTFRTTWALAHGGYDVEGKDGAVRHILGVEEATAMRDALLDEADEAALALEGEEFAMRRASDAADDAVAAAADATSLMRAEAGRAEADAEAARRAAAEAERRRREEEEALGRAEAERAESEAERDAARAGAAEQRRAQASAKRRRDALEEEAAELEGRRDKAEADLEDLHATIEDLWHGRGVDWPADDGRGTGAHHEPSLPEVRTLVESERRRYERLQASLADAREDLEVATSRGPIRLSVAVAKVVAVVAEALAAAGHPRAAAWVRGKADWLRERATDAIAPETRPRRLADEDVSLGREREDRTVQRQ